MILLYTRLTIRFDFIAIDGSSISATVIGEAMDSGDKATNKAMSIAFKYACFQVFCIPTEEMQDPDSETHTIISDKIDDKKVKELKDIIIAKNVNESKMLEYYHKSKLEDFTIDDYNKAMDILKKR